VITVNFISRLLRKLYKLSEWVSAANVNIDLYLFKKFIFVALNSSDKNLTFFKNCSDFYGAQKKFEQKISLGILKSF
jgi:hypothetical protein